MNADTDGDGIEDGDEVFGTPSGLQLPAMGASAVRKDLFIEVDWMDDGEECGLHSHRPSAGAIAAIEAAFANAPVANPYAGAAGITLHVDFGQGGPYVNGTNVGADTVVTFGAEFNAYKAVFFEPSRKGYFHYAIFSHRHTASANNSSGLAELYGDDFIVSLQCHLEDGAVSKTTMHEVGHNLNLRHGGFEERNYKPNYNSIMNYRFQFSGIDDDCDSIGDNVLDYSIGMQLGLDEDHLDESAGVCGTVAIDWDGGGVQSDVARNINCTSGITTACGQAELGCHDSSCDVLADYDDWISIILDGPTIGDRAAPEIITCKEVSGNP